MDAQVSPQDVLVDLLRRNDRNFMSLSMVKAKLRKAERESLDISTSSSAQVVGERLAPYLGERLAILTGARSRFLAFNQPLMAFVHEAIQSKPGSTPKGLARLMPFKKAVLLEELNGLLASGDVTCKLNDRYEPKLYPANASAGCASAKPGAQPSHVEPVAASEASPVQTDPPSDEPPCRLDDRQAFASAVRECDRGQMYIRICNVRRRLDWPRARFDAMLETLRDEGVIQMHGGDVSTMSEQDVRDSYMDENNFLHLTLTWRGS